MIFGGAMMLAIGTGVGEWGRAAVTPRTAIAVVYLAMAGSVIGFAGIRNAARR